MNKVFIQVLGLFFLICVTAPNVSAVALKETTETNKHKYVGDPMLMQASEPTHIVHQKDASVQLAQITSFAM